MAGQFAAAAVPDLRQPPQRVIFPRFRQFQRTIHRLPPGALTPRIVTAPRDDAIFVFLHKPPEVVIAVARFPPVPARRDHLPPGIVGIGLDIATIISHLDQPVQRVILTGNLPVYLLLSTVFRQYFTQQPGLVVHIIGQLIRRSRLLLQPETIPAETNLVAVLIDHTTQLPQCIVAVLHLRRIRETLPHHPAERIPVKRLAAPSAIRILHRQAVAAVCDIQQAQPGLAIQPLHPDQLPVLIVGIAGLRAIRRRHRGKTVHAVVLSPHHPPEHVRLRHHLPETIVTQLTPGTPIRNPLRLVRPVIPDRCGRHRTPRRIQPHHFGQIPPRIVPEPRHRFRRILLRSTARHQTNLVKVVVGEIHVVPGHVADPDHIARQFVVTIAHHCPAAPVHNLAHLAEISDVVAHEVVNRTLPPGEFRNVEHTRLPVVVVIRLPPQPVGQRHLPRLRAPIRIVQHRVGKQTPRHTAAERALLLRRLTQRGKALRLAFMLHFQIITVVAPRHPRQIAAGIVGERHRIQRPLPVAGQLRDPDLHRLRLHRLRQKRNHVVPIDKTVFHPVQHHRGNQLPGITQLNQPQPFLADRRQAVPVVRKTQCPAGRGSHLHQLRVAVDEFPAGVSAFSGKCPIAGLRTLVLQRPGVGLPLRIGRIVFAAPLHPLPMQVKRLLRRPLLLKKTDLLAPRRLPQYPVLLRRRGTLQLRGAPAEPEHPRALRRGLVEQLHRQTQIRGEIRRPQHPVQIETVLRQGRLAR